MSDTLLLIHAFPVDASMWDGQKAGSDLRVLAPNLPGFGGAPTSGGTMTMSAAASRCVDALDEAGVERAVVCGLSMGGYVAFEMWRTHRSRIAGLVLANTRSEADDDAGKERRRALAERLTTEGSDFLVENPPPLLSADASTELWAGVKRTIAAQPARSIGAASLGMAERPDSSPDLASIDVPTLVITSSGDTLIPAAVSSPMAELVPGARLAVIRRAGHLSNLEAPDEFNSLIREHASTCP